MHIRLNGTEILEEKAGCLRPNGGLLVRISHVQDLLQRYDCYGGKLSERFIIIENHESEDDISKSFDIVTHYCMRDCNFRKFFMTFTVRHKESWESTITFIL